MRSFVILLAAAGLTLSACGGGGKSKSGGGGGEDAFTELQGIPAQVDEKVAGVTGPVDKVDIMLDQMKVLPNKLDISKEQFGELINAALADQEVVVPESVQGQNKEELTKFLGNFKSFRSDLAGTPSAAKDLIAELAETSARIPVLATKASTSAATTIANPLASKKDKDAARKQQGEIKTIQKDAQARVSAAQSKVGDLPSRSVVAMNKFVSAAKDMGIKENLLRAAAKPVDDAKAGAKEVVDTAKEGANNAVEGATGN